MSPDVKCLHPTSSRREMCTLSVSNVIYHKFSHGAAFYTLNEKNVNVMLEFCFIVHRRFVVHKLLCQTLWSANVCLNETYILEYHFSVKLNFSSVWRWINLGLCLFLFKRKYVSITNYSSSSIPHLMLVLIVFA